jgi:hypothetical protein
MKSGHASIPGVEFEPSIQVFERAKVFHALDSVTIAIASLKAVAGKF